MLSLGLGSSVVSPLELASAFSTFANGGIYVQPYTVERVEDIDERITRHAEHWRMERMPAVDRNILRLAVFEMAYGGTPAAASPPHKPTPSTSRSQTTRCPPSSR